MNSPANALTIDVEDHFHVSALAQSITPAEWDDHESRVEHSTRRLLDLFDQSQSKATFFILGWVAQRCPELIREIHLRGHEVASHGMSHQLVYNQSQVEFREESRISKEILEDIIQQPVSGYRAASYSITNKSLWALEILAELGYAYDSSIFPITHDRYGIPDARPEPHKMVLPSGKAIIEFPLTISHLGGATIPIAGGGYFRIFPYWFFKMLFAKAVKHGPSVFYLHPWEIDPDQPRIKASWLSTFRHYTNLDKTETRLYDLLHSFAFVSMKEVLQSLALLASDKENHV